MKPIFTRITCAVLLWAITCSAGAQNNFFRDAAENSFGAAGQNRAIIPSRYRTLSLDREGLANMMQRVPAEKSVNNRDLTPIIEIPMPDGGVAKFHIWESSVLAPELAAKYPGIKTFTGQGIDDPTANIKLDWTQFGFHAMIISSLNGAVFVDPYAQGNTVNYISYNKKDYAKAGKYEELPLKRIQNAGGRIPSPGKTLAGICIGTQLRTYRLALAANGEYTTYHGGTKAGALAAEATTMNRVNGVYERELSIRMILIANNDLLIYTNGIGDPYTNENTDGEMLAENQTTVDAVIGNANYDIGHVFSTGGGGIAVLGCVCVTGIKAQGVTGTNAPVGDPYDIDYVAHEMGHQFGADHPFNSTLAGTACQGNGSPTTNAEPGSGSTIMAYAGICGSDDLQNNSDAQFHAVSLDQISANSIDGNGSTCGVITATGNTPPTVNAGAAYTIPKSTPFVLSGSGSDANGDALTYSWEQVDVGGPFGTWDNPSGNAPLFRSFTPKATPIRYFPQVANLINNTTVTGELLPGYARIMHFRLTARDNRAGGGGVCFGETAVTVDAASGPFVVTYPNVAGIIWQVNDFKTITWNPAGSAAAPINCANVKIELSTDGGINYPVTLVASIPNDGSQEIQVPANITARGRIRVSAVGNVFFDISNLNFSIQNPTTPEFVFNNPDPVVICNAPSAATIIKTAALNSFATAINLTATGNPANTTVSFGATSLAPGASTTVTLNNTTGLAPGTYNITVNGIAGAVNKSRIIAFVVDGISSAPANLTLPLNNAIGVATLPSFNWSAVPSATSYTIEISTSNVFAAITQTVSNITTLPFTLATALAENTVYYWRVRSGNSCGTGNPSFSGSFKTGGFVCAASTDIPKTISALGTPTVNSTLVIPADQGVTISDLNVTGLKGLHAYINDITVTLVSPAGTSVVLWDQICDAQQNFDLNLDDQATIATFPCPPTGGVTVKPQNPLSAFNGESSAGTWTLRIKDNFAQDGGTLTGWGLCFFKSTPLRSDSAYTMLCPPTAGTTLTSNITGATYQWQVNTGTGFVNIANSANYAGASTASLQLINIPTSWTGYQYRCIVGAANSNVYTIRFANYWNGTVSNAWETPANWSCNAIPDAFTDVYVNSGTSVVSSNGVCRKLYVNPGAAVTVNTGFKITVNN